MTEETITKKEPGTPMFFYTAKIYIFSDNSKFSTNFFSKKSILKVDFELSIIGPLFYIW